MGASQIKRSLSSLQPFPHGLGVNVNAALIKGWGFTLILFCWFWWYGNSAASLACLISPFLALGGTLANLTVRLLAAEAWTSPASPSSTALAGLTLCMPQQ